MTSELVVQDTPNPGLPSLSDGPDPASAVAYAAKVSTQIAAVLEPGNGFQTIQGRKHVTIEGWQSIAAMTGHSVEVEWSRPVDGIDATGLGVAAWEARAVVRDQHGRTVASGESMADPSEKAPWGRQNYSIRSMAQTRAMSRALASRLRYIVQLAGFAGTPAEEMGDAPQAPDPLEVARQRFKILTRAEDGLAQTQEDVMARLASQPERLADDAHFAYIAFMLGIDAETRDREAEETDNNDALADELIEVEAEVEPVPGQTELIPDNHDDVS